MNPSAIVCAAALALGLPHASAQLQATSVASASSDASRNARTFVAWSDAARALGDVQALDSPGASRPRWSAAAQLRAGQPGTSPRAILGTGMEQQVDRWNAMSARLSSAPLGAIRNANLWFTPPGPEREAMVYAGTVHGTLHGFAADDGSERFAYVPQAMWLSPQRNPSGVDGPIFTGDALIRRGESARTLLVAGLGAGGKGFVVLDVSAPDRLASARENEVALQDTTTGTDPDIGQIHAPPVLEDGRANRARHFVQMTNGRWALVIGNGYFSDAGRPVLLIQYLDQARELLRLSPCLVDGACAQAGSNGLGMPRLLDTDGDGRMDLAYAADLRGNVWRFDLSGAESTWSARHLFTACDTSGRRQPVTTAPYAQPHPRGGWMLVIGTGRHLQDSDSASTEPQSIYGLHDRDGSALSTADGACQRPESLATLAYGDSEDLQNADVRAISPVARPGSTSTTLNGWVVDLPHPGQRVLDNPLAFEGHKVLVRSVIPTSDRLQPRRAGRTYLSVLNMLTGQAPDVSPFGLVSTGTTPRAVAMARVPTGPAVLFRRSGEAWLRVADGQQVALRTASTTGARAAWREQP